jgi:rhomboid protease GluP
VAGPERALPITPDMLLGRRVDFERRMRRFPPVTAALVAVLTAIFAGELTFDALESREAIVAAGALAREEVAEGQYWRLVTAVFLHGGPDHLVSNAIALVIVGMVCEHAFGRAQYFLLFLASGVAGSLASLAFSAGPSVGASGAIFGLQGAAIVLFGQHQDRLLIRDRRIGFVLLVWAAYAILSGLRSPLVDNGAHVGGAIAGAVIARRLHPVVLDPIPPVTGARIRGALWVAYTVLGYVVVGWAIR